MHRIPPDGASWGTLTAGARPHVIERLGSFATLADLSVEERDIEAVVHDLYTGAG